MGLVLGGATVGSALGIAAAGQAAAGAWAKEAKAGKPLNFSYIILTGMPLSQTIYGFILMLVGLSPLITGENPVTSMHAGTLLGIGIAGGLAEMLRGLVFIIIAMGIVETVGLFGFVFLLLVLPK
ncbi:MAG: hypothetical protein AMJ65_08705 [Phycisphaerae bacterium SG8_4]|nr:MAG: hypothetical protein AMJ65_08705 [Phycisphaerae bacterium SG8_4]